MNLSDRIGIHAQTVGDPYISAAFDLGFRIFVFNAGWNIIEEKPGQYDWSWLDQRLDLLYALKCPPPMLLISGIPLWAASNDESIKSKGTDHWRFSTKLPDERVEDQLNFVRAIRDHCPEVKDFILDREYNLRMWWTGSTDEFIQKCIIAPAKVLHEKEGTNVIGPGVTIMKGDSREQFSKDCFKSAMEQAAQAIDFPSLHSYPTGKKDAGAEIADNLMEFCADVQFDLFREHKNLWISEMGCDGKYRTRNPYHSKDWNSMAQAYYQVGDFEEIQLLKYTDFFNYWDFSSRSFEDPNVQHLKGFLIYSIFDPSQSWSSGLLRADGTPTKAATWISTNFLKGETQ